MSLLNSGVDLMKHYSDKNYMSEKGMNFDSQMRGPSTNIYQKNFSGTSNVYSPYLYYNKNSNDNKIPKEINSVLGNTTMIPTTTGGSPITTRAPTTTMATNTGGGPTTTRAPTTTMGNTTMGNTTTTRPMTTMGNTTTTRPMTTMGNTTTTRPMTTMGNTTTTRPMTTMGNTTTTRPMTTIGNTTTTMGNTTTTMGNTTTTKAPTTTMATTTTGAPTTTINFANMTEKLENPPNNNRTYSSIYNTYYSDSILSDAPPGFGTNWTPQSNTEDQHMTIDLSSIKYVKGTVTQGSGKAHYEWVETYKVSVSTDGVNYNFITETGTTPNIGSAQEFTGNTDRNTRVTAIFNSPIRARYVRFHPVTFNSYMSMRAGVIVLE